MLRETLIMRRCSQVSGRALGLIFTATRSDERTRGRLSPTQPPRVIADLMNGPEQGLDPPLWNHILSSPLGKCRQLQLLRIPPAIDSCLLSTPRGRAEDDSGGKRVCHDDMSPRGMCYPCLIRVPPPVPAAIDQ
ncbi:hypothetical protein OE88DRAFT_567977 [Heliocybe sulcata]|uniref:Uncharacterized protein n=1 Tax=Heliocybe sulcata TaxID=5364 RepID=A0A5C3MTZ8_9AGAM|nr:hypothetical protein OE88DRAFT_567977 [Heliocybe sulcata]